MHGGNTPWISDGTPHQWTIPASDWGNTLYQRGDSVAFVPDMFFLNGQVVPQCSATVTTNCSDRPGMTGQLNLPAGATNDPGNGALTFYYTNQQSARLLFYHDHAYGTTRLNVYAGEASAMVIRDNVETDLINGTNASGVFTKAGVAPCSDDPGRRNSAGHPGQDVCPPEYGLDDLQRAGSREGLGIYERHGILLWRLRHGSDRHGEYRIHDRSFRPIY